MEIKTEIKGCEIKIISPYAPNMGYGTHIRDDYWKHMKEISKQNTGKQCTIWGTDNNGQIQMDKKQDDWGEIGHWAYAAKTAKGDGEQLKKYCTKYQLSVTNTKFMPKNQNKQHLATLQNTENGIKNNSIISR